MARLDPTGVSRILSYIKNWVTAALGGKANSSHTHSNYVPRSGGTGEISIFSSSKVYQWEHGAYLSLFSEDYTGNSQWTNAFRLVSINSSTSDNYVLLGDSSGNLSWNGVAISLNGHTHTKSQITDFPAYGNTAGTICQGNDSRLSDARTPYFANNTWYAVGDDAAIGDHNVGGGLGVKALNSTTTRIDFCYKDDASNYKSITYDGTTLYMNGNCDYATSAGGVAWSNVTGKPTIPTKTSQLTNDSGFLSAATSIKVTRGKSISTSGSGYWAAMCNSTAEGSPTLPTTSAWWHVLSMDWSGNDTDVTNWCSQLALPTQDGSCLYWRKNDAGGTSINSSTWHKVIDDTNIGSQSVNYANYASRSAGNGSFFISGYQIYVG